MAPTFYDPQSENEQALPLPTSPSISIGSNMIVQPPLTRRGTGPGLLLFLPPLDGLASGNQPDANKRVTLDPEPIQKWAEEGFCVLGVYSGDVDLLQLVNTGLEGLLKLPALETKDNIGVIVYHTLQAPALLLSAAALHIPISCLVTFGADFRLNTDIRLPTLIHSTGKPEATRSPDVDTLRVRIHAYPEVSSPYFVLPGFSEHYNNAAAGLAHSRSLSFIKKNIGGPYFDLEAIWEEHTYLEFDLRSVAKTMATMVAEPYVNHVPTMTGGMGRQKLTEFYRDHFIFSNPADTTLRLISRTVGGDRLIDEFIFSMTHDRMVDWLLPGVPATHRKLSIPMIAIINFRGDRLYHEHIMWDQGTVLLQAGLLPTNVTLSSGANLRLPVAGDECARLLANEMDGESNQMMGTEWGIRE